MIGLSTSQEICTSYTFPFLDRIEQVLEVVEGRPEFVVAQRSFGTVIDYNFVTPDTFPWPPIGRNAILRECRGIMFDENGDILSRPFHKFFNAGERPETQFNVISKEMSKVTVYPKMDGSMVRPVRMPDGRFRLGTRMGLTDVAMKAEQYLIDTNQWDHYRAFFDYCYQSQLTPLFEYCAPDNRIVVQYHHPMLVLLNIRNNLNGVYYGPHHPIANELLRVKVDHHHTLDIHWFVESVKEDNSGIEGHVIELSGGNLIKLKTDWYVTIHRTRDSIMHEKHIVRAILEGTIDDIIANVPAEDAEAIQKFQKEFWDGYMDTVKVITSMYDNVRRQFSTQKDFALCAKETGLTKFFQAAIFACWNKNIPINTTIKNHILNNCGTQKEVDSVRWLWNNVKYVYQGVTSEEA